MKKGLDGGEVFKEISKRHKKIYKDATIFSLFGHFMLKEQLVEQNLKQLLANNYDYEFDKLQRHTLSGLIRELESKDVREDFIFKLRNLNEYRNYVTHELLIDEAMNMAMGLHLKRGVWRTFEHALFSVEQVLVVYDWILENGTFDSKGQRKMKSSPPIPKLIKNHKKKKVAKRL